MLYIFSRKMGGGYYKETLACSWSMSISFSLSFSFPVSGFLRSFSVLRHPFDASPAQSLDAAKRAAMKPSSAPNRTSSVQCAICIYAALVVLRVYKGNNISNGFRFFTSKSFKKQIPYKLIILFTSLNL